ncbi:T9SS type A sorting domain-containing protein [Flavobacterium stagni]|uniref:T9SS type A sorting domain-containing protein n=1 Tax=Flavobacterium stagni TaxID=2506421 RepID=A0A4Q1KA86_9FLAO|nr:T9SS type A sorting domain-containing protein [Flavobacterium stagni]RXR23529.1 T9SS type A sorting domain-containing protein [Flavobacterium stagni]
MNQLHFILRLFHQVYAMIMNACKLQCIPSRMVVLGLVFLRGNFSDAQIINFPDINFKNALLSSDTNNIAGIGNIPNVFFIDIDSNGNNEIEVSEALSINYLFLSSNSITNLSGIEFFTNLTYLRCDDNFINSINLSQLVNLVNLNCSRNLLSTLDISSLSNLENLFFTNNQITNIDFSNNPQLEVAYCGNNLLSQLDFSNNPHFYDLGCKNNPNLTELIIKNNAHQVFGTGTWLNECWTGCPSLSRICADSFELSALQTYLSDCGIATSGMVISSSCALDIPTHELESWVVSPNPNQGLFTVLFPEAIPQIHLELYSIWGQKVYESDPLAAKEVTINATGLPQGIYYLVGTSPGGTNCQKLVIE